MAEPTPKQKDIPHADPLIAEVPLSGGALTEGRTPSGLARPHFVKKVRIMVREGVSVDSTAGQPFHDVTDVTALPIKVAVPSR